MPSAFIAYPGQPPEIGRELESARTILREAHGLHDFRSWKENDICGRFLVEPILSHIADTDLLAADITCLNFNVTFEIGYAIGRSKRIALIKNKLVPTDAKLFSELGVFDTLGYQDYATGKEVADFLATRITDLTAIPLLGRHTGGRPRLFLLEPPKKDSYDIAVTSAVKKARLPFENYDPQEQGRLPAKYAIDSTCFADALVARLLPPTRPDHLIHNTRVAFCLGLSHALDREFLILQDTEEPVPLDYRELVKWVNEPSRISQRVGELALSLWEAQHAAVSHPHQVAKETLLSKIDFGSPIAENEGRQLSCYYLESADFNRAQRGEYQVVTGRKGSGKTAFFLELRNSLRRNPNNLILDLQPEGYQLLKFRETTLASLVDGSKQHLLTALWEYVLLLEIAHRILRDDKTKHVNDHRLLKPYHDLVSFLTEHKLDTGEAREGDFAERLEYIMEDLSRQVEKMTDEEKGKNTLKANEVTTMLHKCDIHEFRLLLTAYLQHKEGIWILVDNLDKGWPATGLHQEDLVLVRCLQDALFRIEKPLRKNDVICRGVLFLRSDVYDRLKVETPDKGKTLRASLDLSNPEILSEIARLRIAYSLGTPDTLIDDIWPQLCISHIRTTGEDSFRFVLARALMRPRGLIEILRSCQSTAITLGHDKITDDDLKDGLEAYSVELVSNISLEIRDVYPSAPEVLYVLLGCGKRINSSTLQALLIKAGLDPNAYDEYLDLLLRYGVLGLVDASGQSQYIYNHRYELLRLKACQLHLQAGADPTYEINPAFWAALEIDEL